MKLDPPARHPQPPVRAADAWLPVVLVIAVAAVYANTFHCPFLFDDAAFLQNPRTRQLWPLSAVLGDSARPLLRLSLAVNYAISQRDVWSYHAVNLGIHVLATLTLYGLARRTLQLPQMADRWGTRAGLVAAVVAGLWALHPLAQFPFIFAAETARRHVAPLDDVADRVARRQRNRWFAYHMGDRSTEYRPAASFTR